ncbi:hypothetical protein [Enterovibrio norvegicus]|uniref:hypothetical protein n=1 Tax=Enterovibrio norvegicus TaxID=188144 RepID=UPI0010569B13|nr:hypothetical protein [Enterovibrio norvegicus]
MIDFRSMLETDSIDLCRESSSDSECLLNFSSYLKLHYTSLLAANEHEGDEWDDWSEMKFQRLVFDQLAKKYCVELNDEECHRLGFSLHCWRGIHHIECFPKYDVLNGVSFVTGNGVKIKKEAMKRIGLGFVSFCDGKHWPSFGLKDADPSKVNFNLIEAQLFDRTSGYRYEEVLSEPILISPKDVIFELVIEDYNVTEHKFYRNVHLQGNISDIVQFE